MIKCTIHNNSSDGFCVRGIWYCKSCWKEDILNILVGKQLDEFTLDDYYFRIVSPDMLQGTVILEFFIKGELYAALSMRYLSQANRRASSIARGLVSKKYNKSIEHFLHMNEFFIFPLKGKNRSKEIDSWYSDHVFRAISIRPPRYVSIDEMNIPDNIPEEIDMSIEEYQNLSPTHEEMSEYLESDSIETASTFIMRRRREQATHDMPTLTFDSIYGTSVLQSNTNVIGNRITTSEEIEEDREQMEEECNEEEDE